MGPPQARRACTGTAFDTARFLAPFALPRRHQVKLAQPYVDVITSSGFVVGTAIDLHKLQTIATANEKKNPIAVCSGVSLENVKQMLPFCNAFLVNTHFCTNEVFDKDKLKQLVEIVKAGP